MPSDHRPMLGCWTWRCPDCHGVLLWVRDNFQGRRLLAVLTHEAEATADELMARGILRFAPDSMRESLWLCCCNDLGPTRAAADPGGGPPAGGLMALWNVYGQLVDDQQEGVQHPRERHPCPDV